MTSLIFIKFYSFLKTMDRAINFLPNANAYVKNLCLITALPSVNGEMRVMKRQRRFANIDRQSLRGW